MESYCVSRKKKAPNGNSSVRKIKQNRLTLLSNCTVCGKKKPTFIREPRSNGIKIKQIKIKQMVSPKSKSKK